MTHRTHCALRLGDNLAALHFLRALAKAHPDRRFVHAAHPHYLAQMAEVVCDLPNLQLAGLPWHDPAGSVDLWKNRGGWWERHPHRLDYAPVMLEFFALAARDMGLEFPLRTPADLLFDYPALRCTDPEGASACDVLFVNSAPQSGQWREFDRAALCTLAADLARAGRRVVTTEPVPGLPSTLLAGLSVTGIGQISQRCRAVVAVSTGPSWPTFNIWNRATLAARVLLIGSERVDFDCGTRCAATVAEARAHLTAASLL